MYAQVIVKIHIWPFFKSQWGPLHYWKFCDEKYLP